MPIILKRGTESNRPSLFLRVGEPIFTTDTRGLYVGSVGMPTGKEIEFGQLSASFVVASVVTASAIQSDEIRVTNLHVQTISASVEYYSGSTIHGSLSSNTHQFTGSVSVSGSFAVNGVGNGILTTTGTPRTITGTANQVIVANGDGVAGNPTLSLPQSIATDSVPMFGGLDLRSSNQYSPQLRIRNTSDGGAPYVIFDKYRSSNNPVLSGDPLGTILFTGWQNGALRNAFSISAIVDSAPSGDVVPAGLVFSTPTGEAMRIGSSGNVGIGTTTPQESVDSIGAIAVRGNSSGYATESNVGVLAYVGGLVRVMSVGPNTGTRGAFNVHLCGANYTSAIDALTLSNAGALRLHAYGAGTLVTDSSGNITATSDARMKNISGSFDRGLNAIVNLSPKVYRWNEASGLNTDDVNVGLIAQEVLPYIPEAVSEKDGRYTMSDRPIIAALINAVKELKSDNDALRARLEALES